MDPAILGSLVGVLATALVTLATWAIRTAFSIWRDVAKIKEQQGVYRHLLTQIILRIEWLEEHAPHPHKHASDNHTPTNLLDVIDTEELK